MLVLTVFPGSSISTPGPYMLRLLQVDLWFTQLIYFAAKSTAAVHPVSTKVIYYCYYYLACFGMLLFDFLHFTLTHPLTQLDEQHAVTAAAASAATSTYLTKS